MSDYVEKFTGQVTIKVRFQNAGEYAKFRKYILKTAWNVGDKYPTFEVMTLPFYDIEDVENITKRIVQLLQLGLEVYASNWKVERQLAEEESPQDDEPEIEDQGTSIELFANYKLYTLEESAEINRSRNNAEHKEVIK